MLNNSVTASLLGLLISLYSILAVADEEDLTLCDSHEEVYFSCPLLEGEIVSVCAFGNDSPHSGYVQYRYGYTNKIEILYPQKKLPPKGKFFSVDASEGSVDRYIIKFNNGKYTYIVAQGFVSSLTVLKEDEVVLRKFCGAGGHAFISRGVTKGIEAAPKSPEDFK